MKLTKSPRLEVTVSEDRFNTMIKTYLDYITSGGKGVYPRFSMELEGNFFWLRVGGKA